MNVWSIDAHATSNAEQNFCEYALWLDLELATVQQMVTLPQDNSSS